MNKIVLITFIFFRVSLAQIYNLPSDSKRIVFLGNSITYSGKYVSMIDAYLQLKYPLKDYEIINVGLPSETVSGLSEEGHAGGAFPRPDLHERLERLLKKLRPDVVFACYGMNDGIYLPFDEERFSKFKAGINRLHENAEKSGANIIQITPPIFDEKKDASYAQVLDIYSDWLMEKRSTDKWQVIDIHYPMKNFQNAQRQIDSTFALAHDGVHPGDVGHFLIAKNILLGLGEKEISGAKSFDEILKNFKNGERVFSIVEKKQNILKDAWLTEIGHKRPWMEKGMPIQQAKTEAAKLEIEIKKMTQN